MFDKLWCRKFYVRFIKKTPKNLPTNPLLKMGVGVHQNIFLLMTSVHTVDNIVSLNWIKNTVDYSGPYMFTSVRYLWIDLRTFDFLSVLSTWSSCSWCSWSSSPWPVPAWPSTRSSENSWPSLAGTSPVTRPVSLSRPPPIAADSRTRTGANTPPAKVWVLGSVVPFILRGIVIVNVENSSLCIDAISTSKRRPVGIIKSQEQNLHVYCI